MKNISASSPQAVKARIFTLLVKLNKSQVLSSNFTKVFSFVVELCLKLLFVCVLMKIPFVYTYFRLLF